MSYEIAKIDPERVQNFAAQLDHLAEEVHNLDAAMLSALVSLGETWRDEQYEEFTEFFKKSRRQLIQFSEETKRRTPELRTDAEIIRQSQSIKPSI